MNAIWSMTFPNSNIFKFSYDIIFSYNNFINLITLIRNIIAFSRYSKDPVVL